MSADPVAVSRDQEDATLPQANPQPMGLPRYPMVSVVIPTHARPVALRRAIRSVIDQEYSGDIECIVVHDGEPADHSLASEAPGRCVRVVVNESHRRGLPGARNAGLDVVRGDLVASLDDDDYWLPSKVRRQVELLTAHPDVLVVGSGVVLRTANERETRREAPAEVTRENLLRSRVPELHSSNLMMRREVFQRAGRYNEDVPIPEDYEWLLRASQHSRILAVPEPLIWVDRSRPLGTGGRWIYRAKGREKLIALHPELVAVPAEAANIYAKIAFSYAAGKQRRTALGWLARSLRASSRPGRWTVATFLVILGVPARWIEVVSGRMGKSI